MLAISSAAVILPPGSEEDIASHIAVSRDDRASSEHMMPAQAVCGIDIAQFMTTVHPHSGVETEHTRDDGSKFRSTALFVLVDWTRAEVESLCWGLYLCLVAMPRRRSRDSDGRSIPGPETR